MDRLKSKSNGYSLIELVILIVILSIVCYFIFLNQDAFEVETQAEVEGLAAEMVRLAIHNYGAHSRATGRTPPFPLTLDDAEVGALASEHTPLFTSVLTQGIRTKWLKVGANQYVYGILRVENASVKKTYFYDPLTGAFQKGKRPGGGVTARSKPLTSPISAPSC